MSVSSTFALDDVRGPAAQPEHIARGQGRRMARLCAAMCRSYQHVVRVILGSIQYWRMYAGNRAAGLEKSRYAVVTR